MPKERLNFIAAATRVGIFSLTPQLASASEDQSDFSNSQNNSVEVSKQDDYEIFLNAVDRFIRLDKTTGLREIYSDIEQDPEEHIEIVGSNYTAYLIDDKTGVRKPNWSIKFNLNKENKIGELAVVIDKKWDYFKGDSEMLAAQNEVPAEVLGTIANHAFNVPDEMKNMGWELIGIDNNLEYKAKQYTDPDGYVYILIIREDNTIIFKAPYPFPLSSRYRYKENPIVNDSEDNKA